jgi:tungstate transport system substrate-binding protein
MIKAKYVIHLSLAIILVLSFFFSLAKASERLRFSTTTSVENSGLLEVLLPPFEKKFKIKVDVISVGTGKALKLAENGDVDITLVHAPELEDRFMTSGYGVNHRVVMCNDFRVIGPKTDPAGIREAKTAVTAFRLIEKNRASFISRGDNSGTHIKELSIWKEVGLRPRGKWYLEAGRGMGEVLTMATEKQAYTLTDRATYLTFLKKGKVNLSILFEGDPVFYNRYSIIAVNPVKHPHVNYLMAMSLIGWFTSQQGQKIIKEFGQSLFSPLAIPNPN